MKEGSQAESKVKNSLAFNKYGEIQLPFPIQCLILYQVHSVSSALICLLLPLFIVWQISNTVREGRGVNDCWRAWRKGREANVYLTSQTLTIQLRFENTKGNMMLPNKLWVFNGLQGRENPHYLFPPGSKHELLYYPALLPAHASPSSCLHC